MSSPRDRRSRPSHVHSALHPLPALSIRGAGTGDFDPFGHPRSRGRCHLHLERAGAEVRVNENTLFIVYVLGLSLGLLGLSAWMLYSAGALF